LCCFVSSRRRHTRFSRDWSSDVCSSDLRRGAAYAPWEEALQGLPVLEAEGDPQLRRQQLFQAVTSAVLGGPEGRWLLGFEDIQWMDEASCDLLSFLLRAARNLPLLVLLTAREGELVDNPACSGLLRDRKSVV